MKGNAVNAIMQWSLQSKSLSSLLLAIVVIASVDILIPVQLIIAQSLCFSASTDPRYQHR